MGTHNANYSILAVADYNNTIQKMRKCENGNHIFADKARKCLCGQADIWWYDCVRCKAKQVAKYQGIPCSRCLVDPSYIKELREFSEKTISLPFVKRYKDPVAFGYDRKTGQPLALDRKGRRIDPAETRYNLIQDPHGWKATGKRVRERDKYGRVNL